jgi:hypothetical protein
MVYIGWVCQRSWLLCRPITRKPFLPIPGLRAGIDIFHRVISANDFSYDKERP